MTTEEFVSRLEKARHSGKGWVARCPAHEDHHESLSINTNPQGDTLVKCHAGCATEHIVDAMGIELKDLFAEGIKADYDPIETYVYEDEQGLPLYKVERYPGKRFGQLHYDFLADKWVRGLAEVRRVPYKLPELLEAVGKRKIFIVEGEKDVEKIFEAGGVATCNSGGAGGWKEEFSDYLQGGHIIVVADRDEPGRAHARAVAATLEGKAASVSLVEAKNGKDAYDHLKAGGGLGDFVPLGDEVLDGVELVRSDTVLARDVEWVQGYDNMVAYGSIAVLMGMPGVNKSTWAVGLVAAVTRAGGAAIIVSTEDSAEKVVRPRLEAATADLTKVYFAQKKIEGMDSILVLPRDIAELERQVVKTGARVVVIDPIQAHLEGGNDGNNDPAVRSALAPLAKMAERTNCAVLLLMHLNKTRSQSPMLRAGGSIGIPGVARTCLLMAEHPEEAELGRRVVAGFKNNWGRLPDARSYQVETVQIPGNHYSIRLVDMGTTWHKPSQLLTERKGDS